MFPVSPSSREDGATPGPVGMAWTRALEEVTRGGARIRTWPLFFVILALGLTATTVLVVKDLARSARAANEYRHVQLAESTQSAELIINRRMIRFEEALRGAQALHASSHFVEHEEWNQYFQSMKYISDFRCIDALVVIRRVQTAHPERQHAAMHGQAGAEGHGIVAPKSDPPAARPAPAGEEWIVTYCESAVEAQVMNASDTRWWESQRQAMETARDTDTACITPILHDLPGNGQDGILMYLPVYDKGASHATIEQRRDALWGWVCLRLRSDDIMNTGLLGALITSADIDILDGEASEGKMNPPLIYDGPAARAAVDNGEAVLHPIQIGGRTWTIRATPLQEAATGVFPWALMIGGVVGTFMAAGYAAAVARTRDRALMLASEMTAELREKTAKIEQGNCELLLRRQALDHAAIVAETDADGRIIHVNDNFCRVSGYAREELLGQDHRILSSGTHSGAFWQEMFATLASDGVWHGIVCNRTKGGQFYWLRSTVVALRDGGGKISRYISIRADITEQIHAQRLASEAEAFARATVDALTAHVCILDETGTIIAVNNSWRAYGWKNGARSKPVTTGMNYLAACDRAAGKNSHEAAGVAQGIRDVIRGFEPVFATTYPCHTPSEKQWFTVRVTRLPGGGPVRVVVSHENVSEAILANERLERQTTELIKAKMEADAASKAKSDFLAAMSHEIRTPLNGVIGAMDLIEGSLLSEQQRRFIKIGRNSAFSLLAVINDILDFSKIEAGRMELSPVDFDLHAMIEDVAEMLAVKASEKRLEIVCDIGASVPRFVHADMDRLRQIAINLMSNAIKFTAEGSVTIRLESAPTASSSQRIGVRLLVTDTGIGIPKDKRDRLFKAFSQTDASTTRKFGGTGLGLVICKQLVELMGGSIGVESSPGQGSTFWIEVCLPRAERGELASVRAEPADMKNLRVLVIDNLPEQCEMVARTLASFSVCTETVHDGEAGLVKMSRASEEGRPFGVALIDYAMPGMDGLEVAAAMASNPALTDIPRVLMSSALDIDPQSVRDMGFIAHLVKPIRQSVLYDAISKAVAKPWLATHAVRADTASPAIETASEIADLPGKTRLLLAEDNEVNQLIACEILTKSGYECRVVADGRAAVAAVRESAFDVVLMDCDMPEMDGFEATREIRRLERAGSLTAQAFCRLPIIALTANALKGDRDRCLEAGMDDYATKPIDLVALKIKIKDLLLARSCERRAA